MYVMGVVMGKKQSGGQSAAAIESTVEGLVKSAVESTGAELWAVEFATDPAGRFLRILIDRDGDPVDLDLCEAVSRLVDEILDREDPIEESYYLEVSSAGLDRPLKRESDFERFMGERIELSLYAPTVVEGVKTKKFEAKLIGFKDKVIELECDDREVISVEQKAAASVRLAVIFE